MVAVIAVCCLPLAFIGVIGYSRSQITPTDQFFSLSIDEIPQLNISDWTLLVDGQVDSPLNLTYSELLALPSRTVVATLQCVEGIAGMAVWRGIPVSDILAMADVNLNAVDVVFYAADSFSSSLTLHEVSSQDVLLAYEMNGEPLPPEQGYPLRVVAPGHFGYKWVKWVVHVEVVDYDYLGFWESRGWADNARYSIFSHWSLHAVLFSASFILGALALITGLKFSRRTDAFRELPSWFSSKFHQGLSIIYIGSVVAVFIFWAIQTLLIRGALFYTIHGVVGLIVILLHIIGGLTGRTRTMRNPRRRSLHFYLHFAGYVAYMWVITIGFALAFGVPMLYFYSV